MACPWPATPLRAAWTSVGAVRRILALVLAAAGLSGCLGLVGVVRGAGEFRVERPALDLLRAPHPQTHVPEPLQRAATLRSFWGEPEVRERLAGGLERWTWATGLRLHGVALLLGVVPVPLLVPTGRHRVHVLVEHGRPVAAWGTANTTLARAGCALGLPPGRGAAGCRWEGRSAPPAVVERRGLRLWEEPPRRAP